jgi:H+/gluconate symporter-like permease
MDVIMIIISLCLLVTIAYRGFSVILFAPLCALVAASMADYHVLPAYTELFMGKSVVFVKSFFPIFLLGAVFGKVMEVTGMARSIAEEVIRKLGKDKAILSVMAVCIILAYGGVSVYVAVFAIYPFAAAVFKEAEIPKRLIPAVLTAGLLTMVMDSAPGTPQLQNIIPTVYLGTTIYAAPKLGTICGVITLVICYVYLNWRRKVAVKKGEGYGNHTLNEAAIDPDQATPPWYLSVLPLIAVLAVSFYLSFVFTWDETLVAPFQKVGLPLTAKTVKSVISIWSLIIGLLIAIIMSGSLGYRFMPKSVSLKAALNAGAIGSLLAIMNTASEVGYGSVISSLPGFTEIANSLYSIGEGMPLLNAAIMVNVLAAITGSATGGLGIALEIFSAHWLQAVTAAGIPPEVLHRVASMAAGGMDTLPHNGAIITTLAICGLTHRESYMDIFGITLLKFAMAFFAVFLYMVTGIV